MAAKSMVETGDEPVDVLNIRGSWGMASTIALQNEIVAGLTRTSSTNPVFEDGLRNIRVIKQLPATVIYEDQGINLYNAITEDKQYYLYRDELDIFQRQGDEMAKAILETNFQTAHNDERINQCPTKQLTENLHFLFVDLGAGRMDKAACLLKSAVKAMGESVGRINASATYCAIDIQHEQLCQRLRKFSLDNPTFRNGRHQSTANDRNGHVAIRGLCASYLDTIDLLQDKTLLSDTQQFMTEGCQTAHIKCLLLLGSSLSNMTPGDAAQFLQKFTIDGVLDHGDSVLIGLDRCRSIEQVTAAYGEDSKCWRDYIKNGVRNAGRILGGEAAACLNGDANWEYVARWVEGEGRHMRFARSLKQCSFNVRLDSSFDSENTVRIEIDEAEMIFINQSYKYSSTEVMTLFRTAGLQVIREWINSTNDCSVYLLQKA